MNPDLPLAPAWRAWRISFPAALRLAGLMLALHLCLILLPGSGPRLAILQRTALPLESLLAAIGLFYAAHRSAAFSLRLQTAWSYLALAQALYATGGVLWLGSGLLVPTASVLTLSNLLCALYYPVFLAGILAFPIPARPARPEWLGVVLDLGILLVTCLLAGWALLAGPLLAAAPAPSGREVALALAYPAGDLVLLLALLGLLLCQPRTQRQAPVFLLAISAAALALTHAILAYQSARAPAAAWGLLDLGWGAGSLLAGLAGILQAALPPAAARDDDYPLALTRAWQPYLPWLCLAAVYALLLWRHAHPAAVSFWGMAGAAGLILVLALTRQALAAGESARLHERWRSRHADLELRFAERVADLAQTNRDLHDEMHSNAQLFVSLQKTNQQLIAAMAAKDEMLQNVSHELRTPLMLILGYVELLHNAELGPLAAEQGEAVEIVLQQGERLRFMVNRLLTLQTFEAAKLKRAPLDIATWVEQTVNAWQLRAGQAGISLVAEIAGPLPAINADRDLLGQVLENLLDNAVKFTPPNGGICVRAWSEEKELRLVVMDNGIGIPAGKLAKVFDRFYQVDGSSNRRFGGMGIGLALCRAIVDGHGGRIWAESAGENQGAAFHLALPLS